MSDVIDIRPDVADHRLITPHYIQCRIEQLIAECQKIDVPILITLIQEDVPFVFGNHHAYDQPLTMSGLLDVAKDSLRGIEPMIEVEPSEDENDNC